MPATSASATCISDIQLLVANLSDSLLLIICPFCCYLYCSLLCYEGRLDFHVLKGHSGEGHMSNDCDKKCLPMCLESSVTCSSHYITVPSEMCFCFREILVEPIFGTCEVMPFTKYRYPCLLECVVKLYCTEHCMLVQLDESVLFQISLVAASASSCDRARNSEAHSAGSLSHIPKSTRFSWSA